MLENSPGSHPEPPLTSRRGPSPRLGDLEIDLLDQLRVRVEPLELYARAAPGNHPCTRLGGFDSPEQMAMSDSLQPRLKGAVGWVSLEEMLRAEIDQARGHGISGLGMLEEIEDVVWRLRSKEPATIAMLEGHQLARILDLTGPAVESATPGSSQALAIEALRAYRYKWGRLAAIELPSSRDAVQLADGTKIPNREQHVVVFPDRVELEAEELGRFIEAMPLRSR
jgi:hypothetical protein